MSAGGRGDDVIAFGFWPDQTAIAWLDGTGGADAWP